ncbi:MAG: hypothetical protein KatS3mg077_1364 [Candidatus Binatia bacterium]|nr:MAG: hypothetical protein KatS3mg077_1364 [Candidatus Binatia bacterium]
MLRKRRALETARAVAKACALALRLVAARVGVSIVPQRWRGLGRATSGWPRRWVEHGVPALAYGVLELNGVWVERDEAGGKELADSGGYTLLVAPGLQYVSRRWIAEISMQLPIVQSLNGEQVKTDFRVHAGFRIVF